MPARVQIPLVSKECFFLLFFEVLNEWNLYIFVSCVDDKFACVIQSSFISFLSVLHRLIVCWSIQIEELCVTFQLYLCYVCVMNVHSTYKTKKVKWASLLLVFIWMVRGFKQWVFSMNIMYLVWICVFIWNSFVSTTAAKLFFSMRRQDCTVLPHILCFELTHFRANTSKITYFTNETNIHSFYWQNNALFVDFLETHDCNHRKCLFLIAKMQM